MKKTKKVFIIVLAILVSVVSCYAIGCICSAVILFLVNFLFEANLFTLPKIMVGGLICNIIGTLNSKMSDFQKCKNKLKKVWEK